MICLLVPSRPHPWHSDDSSRSDKSRDNDNKRYSDNSPGRDWTNQFYESLSHSNTFSDGLSNTVSDDSFSDDFQSKFSDGKTAQNDAFKHKSRVDYNRDRRAADFEKERCKKNYPLNIYRGGGLRFGSGHVEYT